MNQQEKDKIVRKLIDTNTTISTMESCTSGLIASMTGIKADTQTVFFVNTIIDSLQLFEGATDFAAFSSHGFKSDIHIIIIGIIGMLAEKILKYFERKLTGWQEKREI